MFSAVFSQPVFYLAALIIRCLLKKAFNHSFSKKKKKNLTVLTETNKSGFLAGDKINIHKPTHTQEPKNPKVMCFPGNVWWILHGANWFMQNKPSNWMNSSLCNFYFHIRFSLEQWNKSTSETSASIKHATHICSFETFTFGCSYSGINAGRGVVSVTRGQ